MPSGSVICADVLPDHGAAVVHRLFTHYPPEGLWIMTTQRRKDPGPDQLPLDFKVPRGGRTSEPTKRGTQPTFATAFCPSHAQSDTNVRRTGLVLSGRHLVWKVHYVMLGSGVSVPCTTSGVALCVATSRDGQMVLSLAPEKLANDAMHGVRQAKCFHKPGEAVPGDSSYRPAATE